MDLHHYIIFFSIAFLYIISPGPAVFIAINYGATQGIKKTRALVLGNSTGLAILAIISALGIGFIITSSYLLLMTVKIIGALVLLCMGLKILSSVFKKDANKPKITDLKKVDNVEYDKSYSTLYKEGLLLSLTNPKALIFFSAIFPQFLDSQHNGVMNMMTLGAIFVITSFVSLTTYSVFGKLILSRILNEKGLNILNTITGVLFVGMAGALAFSDLKLSSDTK